MLKTIAIDGSKIQIGRLGQSLDALNDMFYEGYGQKRRGEDIQLIWKNFKRTEKFRVRIY